VAAKNGSPLMTKPRTVTLGRVVPKVEKSLANLSVLFPPASITLLLILSFQNNLEFVEAHAGANGPYEVTQLINSFLGALAHPWETYRAGLAALSIGSAHNDGWPIINKELRDDREPTSFGDLIGLMRHALAHGNVHFLPGVSGEIQALRLWNIPPRTGKRDWGTIITVDNMQTFLKCFVALAEALHDKQSEAKPQIA
jgi:hypothetical protein